MMASVEEKEENSELPAAEEKNFGLMALGKEEENNFEPLALTEEEKKPEPLTGYAAFEISIRKDEEDVTENGNYQVTVIPEEPVNFYKDLPDNAANVTLSCQLYHIHSVMI